MAFVTTEDGAEIYYKDWGNPEAQPIVFHHGWPLSSDDWDAQMLYFLGKGFRVIASDRRGHGRSSQIGTGHDMDHYASDVSAVVEHLDLRNAVHIGHSTGGGQVARYVAKHGEPQGRVAKAVLVAAVPPLMLQRDDNPEGTPLSVFDGFREALAANRAEFFEAVASGPFYGFNREGVTPSQPVIDNWWRQGMTGSAVAHYEGIKAFSETDQEADLRAITVPVLVLQGDDDQVVPYKAAAIRQHEMLANSTLKIYEGYPHGMLTTHADVINPDILAFGRHLALTLHGAVHFVGIRGGAAVFLAAPVRDIDDLTDAVTREAAVHGLVPRGLGMAVCAAIETAVDDAVERAIASARLRATLPDQVASVRAEDLGGWALLHTVPRSRPLLHQACPAAFDLLALDDPTPRETVEAYLDAAGRVPVACERLHIHRTTLYYRLEHLPESVRAALADGLQRSTLHLALKLLRLWEEEAVEAAVGPLREEGLLRA